jgi:hypothetical protein
MRNPEYLFYVGPNVLVEWLQLMLYDWRPAIMTEGFLWFSSVLPGKCQDLPQIWPQPFPFTSLKTNHSLTIPSFNAMSSELLTALLNKPQINKYKLFQVNIC